MWIEIMQSVASWFWDNKITLSIIGVVVANRKALWKYFVHDPITGGNGVTQPDELAKWLLLATFIGMMFTYITIKWPLELFGMILLAVVGIAKLDKVVEALTAIYKGRKDGTKIDNNTIGKP